MPSLNIHKNSIPRCFRTLGSLDGMHTYAVLGTYINFMLLLLFMLYNSKNKQHMVNLLFCHIEGRTSLDTLIYCLAYINFMLLLLHCIKSSKYIFFEYTKKPMK